MGDSQITFSLRCFPPLEVPFVTTLLLYYLLWPRRRKPTNSVLDQRPGVETGGEQDALGSGGNAGGEGKARCGLDEFRGRPVWLATQPTHRRLRDRGDQARKQKQCVAFICKNPKFWKGHYSFIAHSSCRKSSSSERKHGSSQCG